jgi:uncharacterized phage infection (PIP) family protein YhgE
MESTNLTGVQVNDAASSFLKMMESEEPQGQPEEEIEAQADVEEEVESEEPQEEQETPRYRVKVDGQELEVELDELISGYQRTSDYTKKTQSLAEQRKQVEAERARIEEAAQLRDQYAQRLQVIEQMLTQPEEDISSLKDTDPIGYAVRMAEKVERDKQLAAVRAEREQVQMRQAAEQQQRLQVHLTQEQERLRAAIPELADEAKAPDVRKELRSFAASLGFTEQELSQVYDHRAIVALYKAMQYDRLVKGKPQATKKVQDAPKMLKPGVSQPKTGDDQVNKLRKQLSQSGKKQDAAKLFERFL